MSESLRPLTNRTLLATFNGTDRPGLSKAIFEALADSAATVLDVEQSVVRGHLTLAILLGEDLGEGGEVVGEDVEGADQPADFEVLPDLLRLAASLLGLEVALTPGRGDNRPRPAGRVAVVLVGAPLRPPVLQAVTAVIAAHGANIDRIQRRARRPVTVLEFDVSSADVTSLRRELSVVALAHGIDIAVAPGGLARQGRRLVVLDVDSTLIRDEVIELIADHAGTRTEVAAVTEAAMRGELDLADSLRARVATLAGLDERALDEVKAQVRFTPGARTLVATLKSLGHCVAVVSGGFIEIVEPLGVELGLDYVHANRLEVVDGQLTGRVVGAIVDRAEKAAALVRFAVAEGIPLDRTVAVGDGANDLDMLAVAGLGVAFNAKPVVRAQADTSVSVPYMDTVLFLMGIEAEDIPGYGQPTGTDAAASPR